MPSQILHTMFGEDVLTALQSAFVEKASPFFPPEKTLRDHRPVFVLGCQGPDIFYHNQRNRPIALHFGSLLHRRAFGDFSACLLKKALSGAEMNTNETFVIAYALGFVTHAFLDRACHPYIIYRGENYHSFFERIIDVLMLKQLRGLEPADWDQQKILAELCEAPPPALKEMIALCLAETFPERAGKDSKLARRIDNAFTDAARFYNMSSPSKIAASLRADSQEKPVQFTRRALNYIYPENLPAEIDFLNLNHSLWRYPHICANGRERILNHGGHGGRRGEDSTRNFAEENGEKQKEDTRSLVDIYQDAVKSAFDTLAPIINQYIETGAFPVDAAEKIGNSGLSIQNENGKPCAPNLTEPLPLEKVMEQQRKLRGVE